ncbi:hypothetical protein ACRRTK_024994 [Alexandromys fortis]
MYVCVNVCHACLGARDQRHWIPWQALMCTLERTQVLCREVRSTRNLLLGAISPALTLLLFKLTVSGTLLE